MEIGHFSDLWVESDFIPKNEEVKNLSCVVAETKKDLMEIEEALKCEQGKYFKYYYDGIYILPVVVWFDSDNHFAYNHEDYYYHRFLFKDYAIWSKDKEKAKKILNIPIIVKMTLEEICEALGKDIKIVKGK